MSCNVFLTAVIEIDRFGVGKRAPVVKLLENSIGQWILTMKFSPSIIEKA